MANPINLELIKAKVSGLRVSDMKEVLLKLNMSRSGNKPDLFKRILDFFTDAARLTSQSHRLADENRLLTAVKALDAVYQLSAAGRHVPHHIQQRIKQLERQLDGGSSGGNSSTASAAGAVGQPAKRPRIDSSAAASGGRQLAGTTEVIDDVVVAFLNGNEGLGPQNTKVRCICNSVLPTEPLLQCEGSFCGVWQHAECVKQLDSSTDLSTLPSSTQRLLAGCKKRQHYFCERCRVARADPFWELFDAAVMAPAVAHPTNQTKQHFTQTCPPQAKMLTVCTTHTKRFVLTSRHLTMLRAKAHEYQLQALCLQLDDDVQFRFNWPAAATITCYQDAHCRPAPVAVCRRGIAAKMGPMQRDEPFNLADFLPPGPRDATCQMNIEFEHADASHTYVLLVCLMRRRSTELVKALMKPPESLAAAMQRVQQQMHGISARGTKSAAAAAPPPVAPAVANGAGTANGTVSSDDDEDDVIIGNSVVSLKDPNSGTRMVQAARFTDTAGVLPCAFDLDTFLELAQRTRKWVDPHSSKSSSVQNLQVDAYLTHIIKCLAALPDVTEVEINPEGRWRPAGSTAPFMSVLDGDLAGVVAAAAGCVGAAAGGAAASAPFGDDDDDESDIDEAAEMEELRRAAAKLAEERAARAAAEAARQKQPADIEVIDLLSDSDDDEPLQQQQQQQEQLPPQQQQQQRQGGMVIRLPQRVPPAQPQHQVLQQQQLPGATQGPAARATAAAAAAAVGPAVVHATGAGGLAGSSSSRRLHIEGTLAAAGSSGDSGQQEMQQSPQQQQQQQPLQQPVSMAMQQMQAPQYQQQQLVPGAVMLQQQLQPPSGFVIQGSAGMLMPQGSVVTMSVPMQMSGPMPGGMPPPAVTQYLAQQQHVQQQNMQQAGPFGYHHQQQPPAQHLQTQLQLQAQQGRSMQDAGVLQASYTSQQLQQHGPSIGVSYQMPPPPLQQQMPISDMPYQPPPQPQQQQPLLGGDGQLGGMDSGNWQQQPPGLYQQGGMGFPFLQPQFQQQQHGLAVFGDSMNRQQALGYQHQPQGFAGYADGRN